MGTYLLVDGNSLTYRAFFALPTDMATASGQVTNAVFGFTSMLILVLKEQKPDGVLVAFDRPEPTFRHAADPDYKANREAAPDILRQQMGLVRQVLDALGIQQVEVAGWEADDLIASAVDVIVARGDDVVIVTGDRDSYQLVSDPHVRVLYNRRGVSDYALYDEAGIEERTGVRPALYPQYAALRGDPSDNLPGVPGVGEKTAAKLINQYGGLDGIFANVDKQSPKLRDNLAASEERARKNLEMMVLRRDAPLDAVDFDSLAVVPKPDEVKRLFDFLEFRTFSDRLAEALGPTAGIAPSGPRDELVAEVSTLDDAAEAVRHLKALDVLDVAGAWAGEPGRSALLGLAFVTDPSSVRGRLAAGRRCSTTIRLAAATRRPRQRARSQHQGGHPLPAGARHRSPRPPARHGDRRLPDRPRRGALRARRSDQQVHAVRPAQHGGRRPVSSISTAPASATPSWPPATRSPCITSPSRSRRASPPRAWPTCTTASRTLSFVCWPGWSTSASASTSRPCATSMPG